MTMYSREKETPSTMPPGGGARLGPSCSCWLHYKQVRRDKEVRFHDASPYVPLKFATGLTVAQSQKVSACTHCEHMTQAGLGTRASGAGGTLASPPLLGLQNP